MQQGIIEKNHMDILWHDYALNKEDTIPITKAGLIEKASVVGRCGMMLLSCGTGAWRVRSSMNTLSRELGISCTADIGLMSIEYTCFDGENCFSQSLCLTNTGVNTSKLNRLENFINDFPTKEKYLSGEQIHSYLDEIERIHGLYSSCTRICRSICLWGIYLSPWWRTGRNASCFFRCRYRQLCKM